MVPIEFDHTLLDTLPLPTKEDSARVVKIIRTIVGKRIIPFFRKNRGTDPIVAARVMNRLQIRRLDDNANRVRCVSLVTEEDGKGIIHIHERIFDYLSFVLPSHPESTLGGGTNEERKMLAFAEFMLRHDIEHLLYPEAGERGVIASDEKFAMNRRALDPTFYRMLRNALADEMNGLKGRHYLSLFDRAEQEKPYGDVVAAILNDYMTILSDIPGRILEQLLPCLDRELTTKVLGVCYRRSGDTSYSLLNRTAFLRKLLRMFTLLINTDEAEAEEIFDSFKDKWGVVFLFKELGVPEATVQEKGSIEMFQLFKESLTEFSQEAGLDLPMVAPKPVAIEKESPPPPTKSLKDRIDEARNDPAIPRQVIRVIDKNKLNAVGHSGSKFTELIETLLAIPWGVIKEITVSPQEFEEGLNTTHYGLKKPKELLCDFFANLVWRYQRFKEEDFASWRRNGSSFLLVGPPGVGKTSLAISVATNLGIPFHKISLGGMRDEADLKGHGFTYEGSKPGSIVQGLIKMGVMNGMFILDEADKVEKFAIATLLEILDPEQNHLFHDKYTETTVDIDLSNCHFILTANTLETVPPPVVNRCEVVQLDRYSVDEKVAIAQQHLIKRVRERHQVSEEEVYFDPEQQEEMLKFLVRTYTYEAGVRELERIIRTLFLRIFRKELLGKGETSVRITREKIKRYIEPHRPPRTIHEHDCVGEMMGLGVNVERGLGSLVPIQATPIRLGIEGAKREGYLSMVHATGNIQKIMDESRKVATTAILHCAAPLGIQIGRAETPLHLHFMGASTPKDGPSAGGAIALALASALSGSPIRRDVAMTGEIDTHGRISVIGGLDVKLETACDAGCKTVVIPRENLAGETGIERLSDALKKEIQVLTYDEWKSKHQPFDYEQHTLQVVAVTDILQAAEISFIDDEEIESVETCFNEHALCAAQELLRSRKNRGRCVRVLYIKDPKELDLGDLEDPFWADCGSLFLVRPAASEDARRQLSEISENSLLLDFDASREDFSAIFEKLNKTVAGGLESLARLSMVAPFYSLKQNLSRIEALGLGPDFEGFRLFANNYTAQRVKIKSCKAILNRVFCYLAQLEEDFLDDCPFLSKIDEIYVVDLSFIPEKYRLDVGRAEEIVMKSLRNWLAQTENYLESL
ncbi:S16 family serine protease [Thermodesulfobacteriota bacterium]